MPVAQNAGTWLAWRSAGPVGGGDPVLLIMGLGASSRLWWRLLPHLARDHETIVFDNRGTGDSDPVRGPLTMRELAADAVAVLDAAGVERAHVVGVSMGGMIAQHLALEHRDRVRSLVLGCTSPGGAPRRVPWRLLASSALRPVLGPGGTFAIVAPALYARRTRRERPQRVAEDLERRAADRTPAATVYAQMAAIARHDARTRLPELAGLPTLVLHGEEDGIVPAQQGHELAAAVPGARLVMLPACGHMLTTDAEEATAAAVLAHLDRCAERSSQLV